MLLKGERHIWKKRSSKFLEWSADHECLIQNVRNIHVAPNLSIISKAVKLLYVKKECTKYKCFIFLYNFSLKQFSPWKTVEYSSTLKVEAASSSKIVISISLHGITSQMTIIFIVITARTADLKICHLITLSCHQ
jgi:hypothetical protein